MGAIQKNELRKLKRHGRKTKRKTKTAQLDAPTAAPMWPLVQRANTTAGVACVVPPSLSPGDKVTKRAGRGARAGRQNGEMLGDHWCMRSRGIWAIAMYGGVYY